jgi:hypothetical protein
LHALLRITLQCRWVGAGAGAAPSDGAHFTVARYGRPIAWRQGVPALACSYAPDGAPYRPMWPGCGEVLVVEEYGFWPLDARICEGGPFSAAFSLVPHEEFLLWEETPRILLLTFPRTVLYW